MLPLIILLLCLILIKDQKIRLFLFCVLILLFLHRVFNFAKLQKLFTKTTETNENKPELVSVSLYVEPETTVIAWVHKPIEFYQSNICDSVKCSVKLVADDDGLVKFDIIKSSLNTLPVESRVIDYKCVYANGKVSEISRINIYTSFVEQTLHHKYLFEMTHKLHNTYNSFADTVRTYSDHMHDRIRNKKYDHSSPHDAPSEHFSNIQTIGNVIHDDLCLDKYDHVINDEGDFSKVFSK